MTKKFSLAVTVILLLGGILIACQSTPSAHPAPTASPALAKPAEAAKSVSIDTARVIANNCFTCHGPNGRSPGAIPSLVNLSADNIATRLKNFKNGATPSTVMGRHAKAYSDAEIEAVATLIAGSKK